MHPGSFFRAAKFFHQGKLCPGAHQRVALFYGLAEDVLVLDEFAAHSPPLRTLPAHHKSDSGRDRSAWREGRSDTGTRLTSSVAVEFLDPLSNRPGNECQA